MRLVEERKGISGDSIIPVLTGNGRTERQVLRALASKYNGKSMVLYLPKPPFSFRPGTGLSALKAVKTYLSKYGVTHTLFLVDKEHFDEEDIHTKTDRTLRSFGIDIQDIESSREREVSLRVRGLLGSRKITIYMAVLGEHKCIEEDFAKLVELELKIKVKPTHEAIHSVLRKYGLNKSSLVKKAKSGNLTKSFPGLNRIIKRIEKNIELQQNRAGKHS